MKLTNMRLLVSIASLLILQASCETADEYKEFILKKHNDYRRQQGGSNINKLVWSDTLAEEAEAWVAKCNFQHQQAGRGENLAINTGTDVTKNIEQAFSDWYNEIKLYNYVGKRCGSSCHYTQVN